MSSEEMDRSGNGSVRAELGLLDVHSLDVEDDQIWLQPSSHCGNGEVDIHGWISEDCLSNREDLEQQQKVAEMVTLLENIDLGVNKQRFDSRTYTRPKKKTLRPSLYSVVPGGSADHISGTRTFTKHSRGFGDVGANTNTITKYRHGDVHTEENSEEGYRLDSDNNLYNEEDYYNTNHTVSKPIHINLSEPAHNLHNTFNKLVGVVSNKNNSISNMSPPSLVSSIAMDDSGAFNSSTFSRQGSISSNKSFHMKDIEGGEGKGAEHCTNMDISILDEKEMSTSMLSHCLDDSLTGSPFPSMTCSVESNPINSATFTTASHGRNVMESSLVNSGTFNSILEPIDDKLPNGQPKFQLRKSFLKPDPEDNFDKFLVLNAHCNTDDLRGLSGDVMKNIRSKYDTYRKDHEKENLIVTHNKDDSFLMGDGMSESFLRETGRESINVTYNKLPLHHQQRVRTVNRPQIELEQTILLPNQVLSPRKQNVVEINCTFSKRLDGTYDAVPKERDSPRRNATFRKLTPPSSGNLTSVLINTDNKDTKSDLIDSNKESYDEINNQNENCGNFPEEKNENDFPSNQKLQGDERERSDSRNGSVSPHHVVPLNMDDLEHLAYEQEQKLYQVVSTPISEKTSSADILFQENALSPIHNQPTDTMNSSSSSESPSEMRYSYNVSSLGSLNRLNSSPKKTLPVKRETSAPEMKCSTPNLRTPYMQKMGIHRYQGGHGPVAQNHYYVPDEGLYTSKSAGGSPARSRTSNQNGLERPLSAASPQLTASDNELRAKSGLPASKLRQYSSHKELNRIPGTTRSSTAGLTSNLRLSSKLSFYASNPVLCPKPLVRQASYTIVSKDGGQNAVPRRDYAKITTSSLRLPFNVAMGPQQTIGGYSYGQPLKAKHAIGASLPGGKRPSVAPKPEIVPSSIKQQNIPQSQSNLKPPSAATAQQRLARPSGLPRPSTGIPKRPSVRPSSTYSLAPRPNDQADCY